MAYVAISRDLINDVDSNLRGMYSAELGAQKEPDAISRELAADTEFTEQVLSLLWEPMKDIRDRLEPYSSSASIRCKVNIPNGDVTEELHLTSIETKKAPCFAARDGYGREYVMVNCTKMEAPRIAEFLQLREQREEVQVRWDKVREQVKTFLNASKSLNEALKLWPDLRRYVPLNYLRRVDQKTEKKVREESAALAALKALDIDAVNASTVLARMAGAKV